jgi:hypothetical protein
MIIDRIQTFFACALGSAAAARTRHSTARVARWPERIAPTLIASARARAFRV